MTRKADDARTPYVAPSRSYYSRVRLTAELPNRRRYGSNVWFLGEFEGEAVAVEVYDVVDIVAIRRTLAQHGAALFDSPAYRVDLASDEDQRAVDPGSIPLSDEEEHALLALRYLVRQGLVGPSADPPA